MRTVNWEKRRASHLTNSFMFFLLAQISLQLPYLGGCFFSGNVPPDFVIIVVGVDDARTADNLISVSQCQDADACLFSPEILFGLDSIVNVALSKFHSFFFEIGAAKIHAMSAAPSLTQLNFNPNFPRHPRAIFQRTAPTRRRVYFREIRRTCPNNSKSVAIPQISYYSRSPLSISISTLGFFLSI